jgi:hypothetical protein
MEIIAKMYKCTRKFGTDPAKRNIKAATEPSMSVLVDPSGCQSGLPSLRNINI